MNTEDVLKAAVALVDLWERIDRGGPPPHSDYWHRSIVECQNELKAAVRGQKVPTKPCRQCQGKGIWRMEGFHEPIICSECGGSGLEFDSPTTGESPTR